MSGSGDDHETASFNAEAEVRALKGEVADLKHKNTELRKMMDRIDGESHEIRLLVEKYQNR